MNLLRKIFLLLCCGCLAVPSYAQVALGSVTGRVVDNRGRPIAGALVELPNHSPPLSTTTGKDGYFRINGIPVGTDRLRIETPGYEPKSLYSIPVDSAFATEVMVEMVKSRSRVETRVIPSQLVEERNSGKKRSTAINRYVYRPEKAIISSGSGFQQDVSLLLQARPELQAPVAWQTGMGLNGLPSTSTKVYINDLPFDAAFGHTGLGHQLGPLSLLSPNRLGKVSLHRRIIPAIYGGMHGGVIDVQLAKGKVGKMSGSVGLGLQRSELSLEGWIDPRRRSTYKVVGNYNNGYHLLDNNYAGLPPSADLSFNLNFPGKGQNWEVFGLIQQAEVNSPKRDSLVLRKFMWEKGNDQYFQSRRRAGMGGLRWTNSLGENRYLRSSLALEVLSSEASWSSNPLDSFTELLPARAYAYERSSLLSHTFYKWRSDEQELQVGFLGELQGLNFWQFDSSQQADYYIHRTNRVIAETQLYGNWRYKLSSSWNAELGMHLRWNSLLQRVLVEPRLNMRWNMTPSSHIHVGYSWQSEELPTEVVFYRPPVLGQRRRLRSYDESNLALDASQQHKWRVDYIGDLGKNWGLQLSGFLAYYTNIAVSRDQESFSWAQQNRLPPSYAFSNLETSGTAQTTGASAHLERHWDGAWTAWANVTFQDVTYQGATGFSYPRSGPQLLSNVFFARTFKLGSFGNFIQLQPRFQWQSRRKYGEIDLEASQEAGETFRHFEEGASALLPAFHQLDVRLMAHIVSANERVAHEITFELANVLNRRNIVDYYYNPTTENIQAVRMLGFLPHISYRIKF